jgi:pimeloyl-ACP methyl ester carboxylesterase
VDDHVLGPRAPVLRGAATVAGIHWEARGSGPTVLIVHQVLWSYPQVYSELIDDLSRDHRVVTYDPRGCGASSREGPYDTATDAGTALRSILSATNPDLREDEVRDRVDRVSEYMDPQAARDRAEAWIADDPSEHARALGERLWILHSAPEPLFEGTLAARVAELYPKAHIEQLEGGPISRPGVYAGRIRRLAKGA